MPEEVIMSISPDSYMVLYGVLAVVAVLLAAVSYVSVLHALSRRSAEADSKWPARWISLLVAITVSVPIIWYAQVFCAEQFCVMKVVDGDVVLRFEMPGREMRCGARFCSVSLERGMLFGKPWCRIVVRTPVNESYFGHLLVCDEARRGLEHYFEITGDRWTDKT